MNDHREIGKSCKLHIVILATQLYRDWYAHAGMCGQMLGKNRHAE